MGFGRGTLHHRSMAAAARPTLKSDRVKGGKGIGMVTTLLVVLVGRTAHVAAANPFLSWTTGNPSMPAQLGEVASAAVGDRMYVVGEGRSDTYVYNISGRVWADNAPTRPYPGDHHGVAVVGTDIYLVGGFNGGPGGGCAVPGCQGQMQVFRTATREWETLGSLPYVVEGSVSAVTLDGNILACSGLFHRGPNEEYLGTNGDAGVNPTDCFRYDPSTQAWSRFASMLVGVDHAASGTDGVKMYVFGGRSIGRNIAADGLDLTQVYDPATDTWSYGTPMPFRRGGMGAAVYVFGELLVMGGETDPGTTTDPWAVPVDAVYEQVMLYNPISERWTAGPSLPAAVHGIFPVYHVASSSVIVAGGGIVAAASQSDHLQVLSVAAAPPATAAGYVFDDRINCGGPTVTDAAGNVWTSDASRNPGGDAITPSDWNDVVLVPTAVASAYGALLRTERWTSVNSDMIYTFDAPGAGFYRLQFVFLEVWHETPRQRVFSVSVQGEIVLRELDVLSESGFANPLVKEHDFSVAEAGVIEVRFAGVAGSPQGPAVYGMALAHFEGPTDSPTTAEPTTPAPTTVAPTPVPTSLVVGQPVRFVAGPFMTDARGWSWSNDQAYITATADGDTIRPSEWIPIAPSLRPDLEAVSQVFVIERYGSRIEYTVPVTAPGPYTITLYLIESWHDVVGRRVFNLDLQGRRMISEIDVRNRVGFQTATTVSATAWVSDDLQLRIDVTQEGGSAESAAVYGVEVMPAAVAEVMRVNCGGPTVTDTLGRTWEGDASLTPGGTTITPSAFTDVAIGPGVITNEAAVILQTERFTNRVDGDLVYNLAVPAAGTYHLELIFVEVWHRPVGTRVFDVVVNGRTTLTRFDVNNLATFMTPVTRDITVRVEADAVGSGIELRLVQSAESQEGPAIYGITLLRGSLDSTAPTPSPTAVPTIAPTTGTPTTATPTITPTLAPTEQPTTVPTLPPTTVPTTGSPTTVPTQVPSAQPTLMPTLSPTGAPTAPTTFTPTEALTTAPFTSEPSVAPSAWPTTLAPTNFVPVAVWRINCGGPTLTDAVGNVWESDANLGPGGDVVTPTDYTTVSLTVGDVSTSYASLFETERWISAGAGSLTYSLPVGTEGTYTLQLLFVEMWHSRVGARVFHINVQGVRVLTSFDVFETVGLQTPLLKEFVITVDSATTIVLELEPSTSSEGPAVYAVALLTAIPPTQPPSTSPTAVPTALPTSSPTVSAPTAPTEQPTATPTKAPSASPTTSPTTVAPTQNPTLFTATNLARINCGGPTVNDAHNQTWVSDAPLDPGGWALTVSDFTSVTLPADELSASYGASVLETERTTSMAMGVMRYVLPVATPGWYTVGLLFAEMWHPATGERVFHVNILGNRWLSNFDVFNEAGYQTPLRKELVIEITAEIVTTGIMVEFVPLRTSPNGPAIYSVALFTASPPTMAPTASPTTVSPTETPSVFQPTAPTRQPSLPPRTLRPTSHPATVSPTASPTNFVSTVLTRINCGGPTVTDSNGETWVSDAAYSPGGRSVTPTDWTTVSLATNAVTSSYALALQTERWTSESFGNLQYTVAVPNMGAYAVQLVFSEMWHPKVGDRIFHVNVAGERVLSFFDVYAQAGLQNPIIREFIVSVDSSRAVRSGILIELVPVTESPNGPAIYAITVATAVRPTDAPTSIPTASPIAMPTEAPTANPTPAPSTSPTPSAPTAPTTSPTGSPTEFPTEVPTNAPTSSPTATPTSAEPTAAPTTAAPTGAPTVFESVFLTRINCGGPTVNDQFDNVWLSDTDLTPGGFSVRPTDWTTVALSPGELVNAYSAVLETERWTRKSSGSLIYTLPVLAVGPHHLELMFTEMWHARVGARVFHINVQGVRVISDLDVFAVAGLQTPMLQGVLVEVSARTVQEGGLVVELEPSDSDEGPAIYSIALSTVRPAAPTTAPNNLPTTLAPTPPPSTGSPATPPPTIHAGTNLIEQSCLAVSEAEVATAPNWQFKTAAALYSGTGYLEWTGGNFFSQIHAGNHGLLSYSVHIAQAGNYRVAIRNYHENPDSTEGNDCWLKVDGYEWVKVYSEWVAMWHWMTKMDLGHDDSERPPVYYLAQGHHTLQISGRSTGFAIDRIHLYDESCANLTEAINPFAIPATLAPTAPTTAAPISDPPTAVPTQVPSAAPSTQPSIQPSTTPTSRPAGQPTTSPTNASAVPTSPPVDSPTEAPTTLQRTMRFAAGHTPTTVIAGEYTVKATLFVANTGPVDLTLIASFKLSSSRIGGFAMIVPAQTPEYTEVIEIALAEPTILGSSYRLLVYLSANGSWAGNVVSETADVVAVEQTASPTLNPTFAPATASPTGYPTTAAPTTAAPTTAVPTTAAPTTVSPTFQPVTVLHRINCGGLTVLDSMGNSWQADVALFPGGHSITPSDWTDVELATGPALTMYSNILVSERWTSVANGRVVYNLAVPSEGIYAVTMVFVEMWHRVPGSRVFNVRAEGQIALTNFDIVSRAGFQTPLVEEIRVEVLDGILQLELEPLVSSAEGPAIYGIKVATIVSTHQPTVPPTAPTAAPTAPPTTLAPTSAPTPLDFHWVSVMRVNCGDARSVVDHLGAVWSDESGFLVSSTATGAAETSAIITFNSEVKAYEELYYYERYGDALEYVVPVPTAGRYQVSLFLAENWHQTAGARVFSMTLQGQLAQAGIDVVNSSGWQTAAVVTAETYVSEADENLLRIELFRDPGSANGIAVFAFEVSLASDKTLGVVRINAAGGAVQDALGKVWESDAELAPGGRGVSPSIYTDIGTIPAEATSFYRHILDNERWTRQEFGAIEYILPAPEAGQYMLRYLTMEMWHDTGGARAFHVEVNGQLVHNAVDPFAEAGFQQPLVKESLVQVNAPGVIEVKFFAGGRFEGPAIYAVTLIPIHPIPLGIPLPQMHYGDPWEHNGYVDPASLDPACFDTSEQRVNPLDVPYSIQWEAGATNAIDYREAQGLAYNSKLWVFGGFESDANAPDCCTPDGGPIRWVRQGHHTIAYDANRDEWSRHADIDIQGGLTHCGETIFDGKAILAGGLLMDEGAVWPNTRSIDTVFVYDFALDSWSRLAPLPAARAAGALVAFGSRIHYFGGGRFEPYLFFVQDFSTHWYYDFDDVSPEWKPLAPLRDARNHLGGAAHGGKLYAIGGQHLELEYTDNRDTVEMYDPCTNTWTYVAPLPEARGHITPSVVSFREGIMVVGGAINGPIHPGPQHTDPRKFDAVLFYDPVNDNWTHLDAKPVGGASQVSGVIINENGETQLITQRWNGSWIGTVTW